MKRLEKLTWYLYMRGFLLVNRHCKAIRELANVASADVTENAAIDTAHFAIVFYKPLRRDALSVACSSVGQSPLLPPERLRHCFSGLHLILVTGISKGRGEVFDVGGLHDRLSVVKV